MTYEQFVFPFDEVKKNSKIIIYGAGEVGRQYIEQIKLLEYCECIFFVDKNFLKIQFLNDIKVCNPELLKSEEYDKVIVASLNRSIYETLIQMNIPQNKIVDKVRIHNLEKRAKVLEHLNPDPKNSEFWDAYYKEAESHAKNQFNHFFKPLLSKYSDIDLSKVMDFACGRGRIANIFSEFSKNITCCDVNSTAIDYCKERFKDAKRECNFYFVNNKVVESSLEQLNFEDNTFSFIYSWDAMVHFTYKWLDFYLKEFYRIASNNSYVLIHHSNYAQADKNITKSEDWLNNPHGRTLVSKDDIKFIAQNHGFTVVEQLVFEWGIPDLDCITLLKVTKKIKL